MSRKTLVEAETQFIYGLFDPRAYCYPRYIGKAIDVEARLVQHLQPSQLKIKTKKNSWVKSLLNADVKLIIHILEEVPSEEINIAEIKHIALWRDRIGDLLTNSTRGGTGGAVTDPEAKARILASHAGVKASNETRRKMSESHKTRLASPEARKKHSDTAKRFGIKPPILTGEANPTSKLTDTQIYKIRVRSCNGERGVVLAKDFNISTSHVSDIATGRTRKTSPGPIRSPLY